MDRVARAGILRTGPLPDEGDQKVLESLMRTPNFLARDPIDRISPCIPVMNQFTPFGTNNEPVKILKRRSDPCRRVNTVRNVRYRNVVRLLDIFREHLHPKVSRNLAVLL